MEGLEELKQLAKDNTSLDKLQTIFKTLLKNLDDPKLDGKEMKKSVEDRQRELDGWLSNKP
jgi:hypothetical protein